MPTQLIDRADGTHSLGLSGKQIAFLGVAAAATLAAKLIERRSQRDAAQPEYEMPNDAKPSAPQGTRHPVLDPSSGCVERPTPRAPHSAPQRPAETPADKSPEPRTGPGHEWDTGTQDATTKAGFGQTWDPSHGWQTTVF